MVSLPIVNSKGETVKNIDLDAKLFSGEANAALLHQAVIMYLANKRKGTASTKTRGEVRGGGRKPWRQKGTGRARAGTIRSPLWRGGGKIFGPRPRDYSYTLPQKIRHQAIISSINSKINDNTLTIIDELKLETAKTKNMVSFLSNLKINQEKILLVLEKIDENIKRASGNIKNLKVIPLGNLNAYAILEYDRLILTESVLRLLSKKHS